MNALQDLISQAVGTPVTVTPSDRPEHGDYTTNIAMQLARSLKKPPMQIAKEIAQKLPTDTLIAKVDVAPPGYINITLTDEYLAKSLQETYTGSDIHKGKTIYIEFTDPNPFKEFHIGHLFSNAIGESLARLLEFSGAQVKRLSYQGDVGMHVAKTLWAWQRDKQHAPEKISQLPIEERVHILGQLYAVGAKAFEDDETAKREITEVNKQIYEHDATVYERYATGRQWSLDYFETLYALLGTKFVDNGYFFESESGPRGKSIVEEYLKKGLFEISDGAVVFKGEKYGLHTRVFINSQGFPTYEAKDLGLPFLKEERMGREYNRSLIVTANEINSYFTVVLQALSLINPAIAGKTHHIGHGLLKLPSGKMSSRTGTIVSAKELLDEVAKRVSAKGGSASGGDIAVAAVKYSMLKQQVGQDIVFDLGSSVSLEGDSGPYIQYAYVRCVSVLAKQQAKFAENYGRKLTKYERSLLLLLQQFSQVIDTAVERLQPHGIAVYLNTLAQAYNTFYSAHRIIGAKEGTEAEEFRLALTQTAASVLKTGLYLLGIKTVEKM